MRVPSTLQSLYDQGVITEVVRPLMAGKEAEVYLVISENELRVAKVYKEANNRSFKHRADYTEGRKVRNSRQQRAMNKRSKYGREQIEAEWRSAEVDAIYRLRAAGVRVPQPFDFVDGVLVMELIADDMGEPAPRLVDLEFTRAQALQVFEGLIREVVKMLCAGVVHGDLSDFNVLMTPTGPVLIDFPQAVDPAHNRVARKLLIRDVDNLTQFMARYAPKLRHKKYGREMWDLYERGDLTPETRLTGTYRPRKKKADTTSLLEEIEALAQETKRRREALGLPPRRPARKPKVFDSPPPVPADQKAAPPPKKKRRRRKRKKSPSVEADPFADLDKLLVSD